jgi:hypothetical protein
MNECMGYLRKFMNGFADQAEATRVFFPDNVVRCRSIATAAAAVATVVVAAAAAVIRAASAAAAAKCAGIPSTASDAHTTGTCMLCGIAAQYGVL